MSKLQEIDKIKDTPVVFVIFGATGDLAKKRIFPALAKLNSSNLLPKKIKIVAAARTEYSQEAFRKYLKENIDIENKSAIDDLAGLVDYISLDIEQNKNLGQISKAIVDFEKETGSCPQRIFYMSITPTIFEKGIENLGAGNLHIGCEDHSHHPRIIVEKPFGQDLKSAKSLEEKLMKYFKEDQIYRIDHYLGKETVQNIFAFRFANQIFEPIWNNQYIDSVQITTAERIGVEKRGEFYDKTGALRDITQNHLLQLLSLITMDEPTSFDQASINAKKLEVLGSIKKLTPEEVSKQTIRAQYEDFKEEEKISPDSQTETYAMVKLQMESKRWQGVPFYLRTGKKLPGKVTSIILQFKEKKHKLLEGFEDHAMPNHITIQIQPNEGIGIRLTAKKPGLETELEPVDMEFCYRTSFDSPAPEAYERLILDVFLGDQSLFLSQEIVEESWKVIDPIVEVWKQGKPELTTYKPGTWGPEEAEDLIKKDRRQWLAPLLTICKI